ncbi:MAG: hypothetical protein F9K40_11985 [Kofleriaceae bacterium]|nr:MAG: hypothetical protein F9K40_11985 [Kofleriaceae bacterium]MBZ0235290.1 hypothetical protein [Kofleriaceae bacterium]
MADTNEAYFREGTTIEDGAPVTIHVIVPGGAISPTSLDRVVRGAPAWDEKIGGYALDLIDTRGNVEHWRLYPHKGV